MVIVLLPVQAPVESCRLWPAGGGVVVGVDRIRVKYESLEVCKRGSVERGAMAFDH